MSSSIFVRGIDWQAHTHEGKIAFSFALIAIVYNPSVKKYEAWSLGEKVFSHASVAECLNVMTPHALEYAADQFVPIWEDDVYEMIDLRAA